MRKYAYIVAILFSFIACSSTAKREVSPEDKVSIIRFDKEFHSYLKNPKFETENLLKAKYPALLSAFGLTTVGLTLESGGNDFYPTLREYFGHPMLTQIYEESIKTFNDVSSYEEQLTQANSLIAEHITTKRLPKLSMHVSGFKENVIVLEDMISISSDKYLGSNYAGYKGFSFEPHQLQQMQPKMIVRDYLKAWLISDVRKKDNSPENLLSVMVEEGKTLYILSVLLPQYNTYDLIGYTEQQLAWCNKNAKNIWQSVIKQKHLYSTDFLIIDKYIDEAPFTSTISDEAPGQCGNWIGWQIVNQYAKKTGKSIKEIINLDAQTILKESKYNP